MDPLVEFLHKHLAPLVSRLVAAGAVAISPYLVKYAGIEIDADTIAEMQKFAMGLLVYFLTHRLLSRKTNPTDVAKPLPVPPQETLPKSAAVQVPPVVPNP